VGCGIVRKGCGEEIQGGSLPWKWMAVRQSRLDVSEGSLGW
jgi:hypothetical protein